MENTEETALSRMSFGVCPSGEMSISGRADMDKVAACFEFQEVLQTTTPSPISFVIDWTISNFSFFEEHPGPINGRGRIIGKSIRYVALYPFKKAGEGVSPLPADTL